MGFFDSLEGADLIANAEAVGFTDPDAGYYTFTVVGGELKKGTQKNTEAYGFIIKYILEDKDGKTKNYGEYLGVPSGENPRNPSDDDRRKASYLKARLISLGIPENKITQVGPDDLVDIEGSLQIVNGKAKPEGGHYVAIRNLKVKAATPQPKATTVRKAPPQRTAAPIASAPEPETSDEATPTAPAQKAMPPKVAGNPFA